MLARKNRVVSADDYRATVRSGRKSGSRFVTVYVRSPGSSSQSRFGFIVSKSIGNAVQRNLMRRRLKSVCAGILGTVPSGVDFVIRLLPGAAQAPWANLEQEITGTLARGMAKL